MKFFIYTFAASVLMLLAILYVYFHDGGTFDYVEARQRSRSRPRRPAGSSSRSRSRSR